MKKLLKRIQKMFASDKQVPQTSLEKEYMKYERFARVVFV
jgi:hypothetical protein